MIEAGKDVLEAFESLPPTEREQVLAELLRRVAQRDHEAPSDEELAAAADSVFQDLDRRESQT